VEIVVLLFFFGLSAGAVGRIKGSSFLIWFLIGVVLPGIGTLAARTACASTPCSACPLLSRCDLSKAQQARASAEANGRQP